MYILAQLIAIIYYKAYLCHHQYYLYQCYHQCYLYYHQCYLYYIKIRITDRHNSRINSLRELAGAPVRVHKVGLTTLPFYKLIKFIKLSYIISFISTSFCAIPTKVSILFSFYYLGIPSLTHCSISYHIHRMTPFVM